MSVCTPPVKAGSLGCIGVFLVVFAFSFGFVVRDRVESTLTSASKVCGEGDDGFDAWRTNTGSDDAPKYKLYSAFNVTNAVQYLQNRPPTQLDLELDMVGKYAMRQYDTKYNITFSNNNAQVQYKTWETFSYMPDQSCDGCDQTDRVTNLNPFLLTALTTGDSEVLLGLLFSSADLSYGQATACTRESIGRSFAIDCDPTNKTLNCCCNSTVDVTNRYSCVVRASQLWSEFAGFDGGVLHTSAIGLGQIHTPLFIEKNVHEFAFGYPSAMGGLLAARSVSFVSLSLSVSNSDLPKHTTMAQSPSSVPAMAQFTELTLKACNYTSTGLAGSRVDLEGTPMEPLSLITCRPIEGVKYWARELQPGVQRCAAVGAATGTQACQCVDSSHGVNGLSTVDKPCCTIAGLGCLYKVTGYVSDELYVTQDQAERDYTVDRTVANTGCGDYEEGREFSWTQYESNPAKACWAAQGRQAYERPTQQQVKQALGAPTTVNFTYCPVSGSEGERMVGTGKTTSAFHHQFSTGKAKFDSFEVYITQVYRAAVVRNVGNFDHRGVRVVKYSPDLDLLDRGYEAANPKVDNGELGAATPFNGVQDVTYMVGFPAYVSRPLFYNNTAALQAGIKVFHNANVVTSGSPDYETFLLVEPASGMTIQGHKRLQASFSLWSCTAGEQAASNCLGGFGLATLTAPFVPGGVIVPQYWMDETAGATSKQIAAIKGAMNINFAADVLLLLFPLVGFSMMIVSCVLFANSRKAGGYLSEKRSIIKPEESRSDGYHSAP